MSEQQDQQQMQPDTSLQNKKIENQQKLQFQYLPPIEQSYQYKIFINQCNGYIGSQLVETFRNDDQIEVNPNLIVSTLNNNIKYSGDIDGVCQIVEFQQKQLIQSVIFNSDIVVFHIDQKNAQQFEHIVKFLRKIIKNQETQRVKRIICISSLITWNGRRSNSSVDIDKNNLVRRNSTQTHLLELQNLCLDINNVCNGIQAYVICSGIVYGYGQNDFFVPFKKALEQSQSLKVYGKGNNLIPTIHLQDLCSMTKQLAFKGYIGTEKPKCNLPQSKYYFGVDSAQITQLQLIRNIAETLGNGNIESIPIQEAWLKSQFELFTLNINIDQSKRPSLEKWHCQNGIISNFGTIVSEFNSYRGLKPNKIIVLGAPAAGKTRIAESLKNAYGLPILSIKQVINELKQEQDQFAQQIKVKIEELRAQKIEEERKIYEDAKKKKKGKKDAVDQFDPDKVVARLPDQDVIAIFKRRLNKSDCLNKGYVLDGWPKSAAQCKGLFQGQDEQICEQIFPNSCIIVDANQQQLKERVKNIPVETREGTHWNQQATIKRFQIYNKLNQQGSVKSYLAGKVDFKETSINYQNSKIFIEFIERNGPLGFKKKQKEIPLEQKQEQNQNEEKPDKNQNAELQQEQEKPESEEQEPQQQQPEGQFDLQKLTEHQKQILNEKSRPIRQYLIDNVIPQITEGLLQICKDTPRDPIQFLIKFLERKEQRRVNKQPM